jgi:hypothetical protein
MEPHGKQNRLVSTSLLTAAKPCLSVKAKPVKAARELPRGAKVRALL